ncbi:MAG TPA: hypothetical protein DCY75_04205 [Clostridiales bacterium]|nr:hypothetical protein [Clostridiales bacterium]
MNEPPRPEGVKGLFASFKDLKGAWIFVLLFIGGILLVIFSGNANEEPPAVESKTFDEKEYTTFLETRLTSLLAAIDGIGHVQVMVTLENTHTNIYAQDTTTKTTETSQEVESAFSFYTDKTAGSYPILLTEELPKVRGVAVVCKNGGNPEIQLTVTQLLTSLLGIKSNRIYVTN